MPYVSDHPSAMRRLIPLGTVCFAVDLLVTTKLNAIGEIDREGIGVAFAAFLLLIALLQVTAMYMFSLLLMVMHDYDFPVDWRLPSLLGVGAFAGAALFWWASPWIGAVCSVVTLTGWIAMIHIEAKAGD